MSLCVPLFNVLVVLNVPVHAISSIHRASNVTVAPLVEFKFLKLVSFVLAILVAVVVLLPYVCVTLSIHVIFHHENVYPALVGLFTVNAVSYVALVG